MYAGNNTNIDYIHHVCVYQLEMTYVLYLFSTSFKSQLATLYGQMDPKQK